MLRRWIAACICLTLCTASLEGAPPADASGWATGNALRQQLASRVSVKWAGTPLRQALDRLSEAQHLAIVLDRRVNPDRDMELTLSSEPLEDCLGRIARSAGLGYSQLGTVAYLGPPETARKLRTLSAARLDDVRKLGSAGARRYLQLRDSHWPILAEPRQLAQDLADEADIKITGLERIPHDLWPAANLPPLTWLDRMTLLLAQFDLTFRLEDAGRRLELIPVPKDVLVTRSYAAGRDASAVAKRWAKAVPDARVSLDGNKIKVEALVEDHEVIERRLRGTSLDRPTVTAGPEVYSVTIKEQPLKGVVYSLAQQLNLDIKWDPATIEAAGISIDAPISVSVKDASLDTLLSAVFANTGLKYKRDDRQVEIFPAEKRD